MSWRARALGLGVAFAATLPAQIFTLDAGVRSPELPSARERIEVRGFAHGDEARATTDVTWSPDRRVETQLDVPWIWRDVRGGRVSGGTLSGLGDLRLRSKVALLRDDAVMRSDRVAVFGDVFVPTGDDDVTLRGVVAPRDLQPGRGTFGAGLGLATTLVRDRHRAAAAVEWRHWLAHDGVAADDEIALDAAWWFRLSPAAFAPGVDVAEVRTVVELRAVQTFDARVGGVRQDNGGLVLDGVLGVQVNASSKLRYELGAVLPLHDDTRRTLGRAGFGIVLGLTLYF